MNREDVVQAALMVERWCIAHWDMDGCEDCPFYDEKTRTKCLVSPNRDPIEWRLNEILGTRGMKDDD